MKTNIRNDSMEILISDLIFKLGKANQQMHLLSQRVVQLEQHLHGYTTDQFTLSHNTNLKKQMIAQ
ncbi:hypothetical protein [Bacillus sp. FSL K6-3431]|uniref:hypothetical protein n=1 Tax=Bacillus sp. FSL K6-3431 TaxID=2921500 RepID=UPI0030F74A66